MYTSEKAIFTTMCMIYDGSGNVVVQERKDPDWGGIAFPGGHVEKEESFVDAAIREVYEETGLQVDELELCGIKQWQRKDDVRYVVFLYKTKRYQGDLIGSDEGEVYWINVERLQQKELADGFREMLRVFIKEEISELYYFKQDGILTFTMK